MAWSEEDLELLPENIRAQIPKAAGPANPKVRAIRRREQELQIEIFKAADVMTFPERMWGENRWLMPPTKVGEFMHHVPNGGGRSPAEGGIFKAMGVRAGYPDIVFDLALVSGDLFYPGWRCELKVDNETPRPTQVLQMEMLQRCGYVVTVARSTGEWLDQLDHYLRLGHPLHVLEQRV